jgi:light-harvesting protein B-800-850 alpha chain
MIYGKMWTVVRPTVGIPLFLGAVAVGSFSVHLALLNNTTWVKAFLEGGKSSSTAAAAKAPAAPTAQK